MGILCSCQQPVIYSKERQITEIDPKIQKPAKGYTNKSTTLKSKIFTKDSTLINHSNDNSPDKDEIYNKILKNKLTDLEFSTNQKIKDKNGENIKKIKTDINKKVSFNPPTPPKMKKEKNKSYSNNIHVLKNKSNSLNRNSVPNAASTIDKLILPINNNNEFSLGFKAGSFNLEKRPVKLFLDLINTNNSLKEERKNKLNKTVDKLKKKDRHFKEAYSIKTAEQESQILLDLHKNFIFKNCNKNFLEEIIDYMNALNYNDQEIIFGKGEVANNFYMIKKGNVLLCSEGKVYKKLSPGDTFGEIALFQNEGTENNLDAEDNISINNNDILTRNYTAIAKGKTKLYSLNFSSYYNAIKSFEKSNKERLMSNNEENLNEKNKELLKTYKFFRYLEEKDINLITKMAKKYVFKKIGNLLSITNYNNKYCSNILFDKRPFFQSRNNLLLIIEGELMEYSHNLFYRKKIKKNGGSGIISILYPNIKIPLYTQTNKENTKVINIPEEVLIEVLGPNYSYEILKKYFFHKFLEQKILSVFLNINENNIDVENLNENDKNKIFEIFNAFSLKEYNENELVYSHKNNLDEKKIILPIINNILIYNIETKRMEPTQNNIIIKEIFYEYKSEFKITSENSFTIVLESKWKDIYRLISNSKNNIFDDIKIRFDVYKDLVSLRPLNSLTIQQIIEIGLNSTVKEFSPKEIIIKNKEKNNIYYLIIKGRIKVKNPLTNKTIRIYEQGNCFGSYYILTESPSNKNYISHQYSKCYCLTSEKFYEFLKIDSFNDYIKNKLLLEDDEMQLNDFYYISYLGKGAFGYVCLVHNEICFYAMKAINRFTIEKGKNGVKNLINEKKCMISIDHPFIVNYVKTLKNDNWVFILEEYIKGKNFEDYLMNRKKNQYKNIDELIFYAGCMFHMLKYLTKRKICHRDIKPKNMMIDTDGYLKLLDFGCSKKIKYSLQTVVGTPNYMSPEVVKGIQYSFNCDYWSVGVCCYLIYFGKLPFGEDIKDVMQLYKDILKAKVKIPKDCPLIVKELIDGLLKKDVTQRINNFDKVLECQIFQDFDWDNLLRKKFKPPFLPIADDFWEKSNLKNLASPFDKFIEKKFLEANDINNNLINDEENINNYEDNNYYQNNDEFNNNWFEYF